MRIIKNLLFMFISCCFTTGCISSFFTMPATLMVAAASDMEAKRNKRYTLLDECMFDERPTAVELGDAIAYGDPLTAKYSKVMEGFEADREAKGSPVPPHYLAYGLYLIGDRIGDMRGKAKMQWVGAYISKSNRERVEKYINRKYLNTWLNKCFFVPRQYKISPDYTDLSKPYY